MIRGRKKSLVLCSLVMICFLLGCSDRKVFTAAVKEFCKGCEGKMSAELVASSWDRKFILKCDDFTKELK